MPLAGCDGGQALPPYLSARLPLVNVREEGPGTFSQNRAMLMVHTCRWVGYWLVRSFHASGRSSRVFALSRASPPAWRTWSKHDWSCRSHQKCLHWTFHTVVFNALVSGGRRTASLCRGVGRLLRVSDQAAHILERGRDQSSPVPPIYVASMARRRQRRGLRDKQSSKSTENRTYLFRLFNRAPVDMGVDCDMVGNRDALVPGTAWCLLLREGSKHASGPPCLFWIGACRRREKGLIRVGRDHGEHCRHGGSTGVHLVGRNPISSKTIAPKFDEKCWCFGPTTCHVDKDGSARRAVQVVLRCICNLIFA